MVPKVCVHFLLQKVAAANQKKSQAKNRSTVTCAPKPRTSSVRAEGAAQGYVGGARGQRPGVQGFALGVRVLRT